MNLGFKFIVVLSSIVFENVLGQLDEGDLCTIPSSGAYGICKSSSLCPGVQQAQQTGSISPKNCGSKNNEEMVCCAGAVGTKSKQKCIEYGQLGYQDVGVIESSNGVTSAKAKEFPHMALLGNRYDDETIHMICGGSLISKKFVLSAAQCAYSSVGAPTYIILGDLVLASSSDDSKPQRILIKNIIAHPEFQPYMCYHDIALYELETEAKLDAYVRPACLNTNPSSTNTWAVNSGWGTSSLHEGLSRELLKVSLDIFTTTECNNTYTRRHTDIRYLPHGVIEETQVCAGSRNESKEICQSGGPLQIMNTEVPGTYKIIGILSFGFGCGIVNAPAGYTRVSAYIEWIEDIVWP